MAKINIIQKGPSGTVQYIEGWLKKNVCEFYFEFDGGDTVAIISFPAEDKWDAKYPWASGRRKEILTLWRRKYIEHRPRHPQLFGKIKVSVL